MTLIHITSCHRCQPEKWKPVGPSTGSYYCQKCRKVIEEILERKEKKE